MHFMHETRVKITEAMRLATRCNTRQQYDAKCISLFCTTHFVFYFGLIIISQLDTPKKTKRNALFQIGASEIRRSRRTREGVVWKDPLFFCLLSFAF
jgi:hypothetical protein